MGGSSSGLLDEAKVSHIKGLVDSSLQRLSVFYRQQYAAAYYEQVHMEVEPKKEGRSLILTQRPQYDPQAVLYQSSVKFWDEQGKKVKERYIVLRRDYNLEVYGNLESFRSGVAAKLIIQPAGGSVFTIEEEFRDHLEKTCSGILNGVKEDSSSSSSVVVESPPDMFAVYLMLPYRGHSCFLFQQEKERHHFLSHLKTCIRHSNLDPWRRCSLENQAFIRALRRYRQDTGHHNSWEMQFGTEEQVLASQVMEEVLPWLQTQLQSKVKGWKRMERIRLWQTTVQATYTVVLEQLKAELQHLHNECRQTASADQMLIRSNLDQIVTSHRYLEQKIKDCVREEAEKLCDQCITPSMSSMTETLTDNISAVFYHMLEALHAHMDSVFSEPGGGSEHAKQVSSCLRSISLDMYYQQVEKVTAQLEDLKQRFVMSEIQRIIFSTHLELEQLQENALYTLEQYIKSSSRLQPSQVPMKMQRAKERVRKQMDYDSRVVQRRLYQEVLQNINLPCLTTTMDRQWRNDLKQFEQHIFSDYSSFILVENIYEDVLKNILNSEIEKVLQNTVNRTTNNLLLDMSDLTLSQYSLLGPTPPRSAPQSPALHPRLSSSVVPIKDGELPHVELRGNSETDELKISTTGAEEPKTCPVQTSELDSVPVSPVIVVTQEPDEMEEGSKEEDQSSPGQSSGKTREEVVAEENSVKTQTGTSNLEEDVLPADKPSDPGSRTRNTDSSTLNLEFNTPNPESSILNADSSTLSPEFNTSNPESSTLNPDSNTLNPDSSTLNPDSSTLNPDFNTPNSESSNRNQEYSTPNPDLSTLNRDSSTLNPDSKTPNSESSILHPESINMNPDSSIPNPDLSTLNPESSNLNPESINMKPDSKTPNPESSKMNPESNTPNSKSSTLNPDSTNLYPESINMKPDSKTPNPESSTLHPESINMNPESCTLNPESINMKPDSKTRNPESSILNPESSIMNPESNTLNPDSSNLNPESNTTNPESSIMNPESNTLNPDSSNRNPESNTTNPESSTLNPDSKTPNSESSTLHPESINMNPDSSIPNPDLSNLNPDSSILNPDLSTPNPDSHNLNPESSTENAKSSILNPDSSTVNAKSSILNPQSSTLEAEWILLNPDSSTVNPPDQKSIETERVHCSTTDVSSSDQRSEVVPCTELVSPDTDRSVQINLGILHEAICCSHDETPEVHQTTDRAVYLKGEMKENWDAENKEKQRAKEDAGKKDREEERGGRGGGGGRVPAEGAITEHEDEGAELKKKREDEEEANRGQNHTEEEHVKEEGFKSSQPIGSPAESITELPLDSIALIRELITEVIDVETEICPETSAAHPDVHH